MLDQARDVLLGELDGFDERATVREIRRDRRRQRAAGAVHVLAAGDPWISELSIVFATKSPKYSAWLR